MLQGFIRRFKPFYALYNLFKKKELDHIESQYKKRGISKRYYSRISNSDFKGQEEVDLPWLDQQDSRVALPKSEAFNTLQPRIQDELLKWSDDGYVILDKYFSGDVADAANKDIDLLLDSKKVDFKYRNKIMFAIHESETIRKMGNDPQLMQVLNLLLGKDVQLFQSINFLSGSEQKSHSDSIHMTTFPLGYLIAVWIALEDINLDNGPLHYYRGSHKMKYIMNEDFDHGGSELLLGKTPYANYEKKVAETIDSGGLEKQVFLAKKGDILIWHANLLHGGEMHNNPELTRKSMVFHYYAKDVICYHEITERPMLMKT